MVQSKLTTSLKKVEGECFIIDLRYNSKNNFIGKNVYKEFGLSECYVHPELHKKLMLVIPLLKKRKLKLIIYDAFRPIEVQKIMWEIIPDAKYISDPKVN